MMFPFRYRRKKNGIGQSLQHIILILEKTGKENLFHIPPSHCPLPCAAAPRCGGTRRCSCWDRGRQRHSTPSSLGGVSWPDGPRAAGSSLHQPALSHPAAAAAAYWSGPRQRTDAGSAAAPSVCREMTTPGLESYSNLVYCYC